MKVGLFALTIFSALALSSCSKPANKSATTAPTATATATPDEFAVARADYAKNCVACHGNEGKGGPVKTPDGTTLRVPSLTEGHALKHDDADYVDQINKGGDGMPKFKDKLTPDEINGLVRFVRHKFQGK